MFWLGGELIRAAFAYASDCGFSRRHSLPARAAWLQKSSRRVLRILRVQIHASGPVPGAGLLVSNHLSYLDILVYSTLTPCVFVAKREIKHWPVFGWFARLGGTVFIDRERRTQAPRAATEIERALASGALVVLFPEGTSSGGGAPLPFKSALLQPAAQHIHPLTAGSIDYRLDDGDVSEEVCYWRDMTLLPHLVNLLGKRAVRATVGFSRLPGASPDRKELARQLHAEISRLKTSLS